MRTLARFLPVLLTLACHAQTRTVIEFTPQSIAALLRKSHVATVVAKNDPVYHTKKRYQGVWLADLVNARDSALTLRFRCKDGYSVLIPVSRALSAKPLIAFRDLDAVRPAAWIKYNDHNTVGIPAPAYLVWADQETYSDDYPWPYQLAGIDLVAPTPVAMVPGQALFESHCMKCHSIDGVGGTLGPELNSPCSVTEYWDAAILARFIANPESVRRGAKMPSFESLSDADRRLIVTYLTSRKKGTCK